METSRLFLLPHAVVCPVPKQQKPLVRDPGEAAEELDVLALPLARQMAQGRFFNLRREVKVATFSLYLPRRQMSKPFQRKFSRG